MDKAFGIRGGMPGGRARELCPQLIFVGGHFKDYQPLGDAAINVLNDFTPLVERISIDEAFHTMKSFADRSAALLFLLVTAKPVDARHRMVLDGRREKSSQCPFLTTRPTASDSRSTKTRR
jgi:nucleotidyltransferase/DNA polymerase involved in DNA repair